MEAMYLTRLHGAGRPSGRGSATSTHPNQAEGLVGSVHEHEEVELLLENYAQEIGASISLLELLSYKIESDEKFVSYRLDSARNRLLKVDVIATVAATAMGAGSMIASIFGMNLQTPLFDEPSWVFDAAVGTISALVAGMIVALLCCLSGRKSREDPARDSFHVVRARTGSYDSELVAPPRPSPVAPPRRASCAAALVNTATAQSQ